MFKVLIIAYYFPPMGLSGVQRTLKFAKYLKRAGWQPTVITTGKTAYYYHDLSLLKEVEKENIKVIRTEGLDPNSLLARFGTIKMPREWFRKLLFKLSRAFFIPDNKKSWAKKAYEVAKYELQKENYDIIFVTLPPFSTFTIAAKLRKEFDIPLVADYRDLWYGNHFSYYPTFYHRHKNKKLETEALRIVDKVVAVNRQVKEKIIMDFPVITYDDITIIPHGYDKEDFKNVNIPYIENKKMIFTYSGIFYETVSPKNFLLAFKKYLEEHPRLAKEIELHFVGFLRNENKELIKKLELQDYIVEHGYLDHNKVIEKLMVSDVLWATLGKGFNSDAVSLGKLFEYFGSKKPILGLLPDGASKNALIEYGAGIVVDPDNVDEIKESIKTLHQLYKNDELPKPNENFVKKHDRKYLTEQLIRLFQFEIKKMI